MTTALDIITGSMKLLGLLFKGESPAADEAADGLSALNDMLDSWSNDDLITYALAWETFAFTPTQSTYTIGTGGDFNTSRPIDIANAYTVINGITRPCKPVGADQYSLITQKDIQSIYPWYLCYDNGYPLGKIRFYPVPAGAYTLNLLCNKPLTSFSTLTDSVSLPPGFNRALKYNLAIEISSQFSVQPSASVVKIAADSLSAVRSATSANNPMPYLPDGVKNGNFYTGWV